MKIEHESREDNGRFYIKENNEKLAEMIYHKPDKNTLLITHTEVDQSMEGKGIGKQLIAAAVEYARSSAYTIMATCPFAKKILERMKDYADVYIS